MAQQSQLVSSDPMDYAKFVLYLKRGVPACDRVAALARTRQEVIVQEIDKIASRPEWLRGVPTLVELPQYALFTGTGAIERLREHIASSIDGIGPSQVCSLGGAAAASAGAGAPLEELEEGPAPLPGGRASVYPDPRYEDAPTEKKQDMGSTLEDMLRRRSQAEASRP